MASARHGFFAFFLAAKTFLNRTGRPLPHLGCGRSQNVINFFVARWLAPVMGGAALASRAAWRR